MSVFVLTAVFVTLIGLTFGSFVNAAVWRIHQGRPKSLLNDRSECTHCHHQLAWFDLVPIFSWLSLRGKCRYCGKKIEDTPLPEVGVMVYFLVSFLFWPGGFTAALGVIGFVFWLVFGVLLAILFIYDLRYKLLPDKLTYTLIALAAVLLATRIVFAPSHALALLVDGILGIVSIGGIYFAFYVVSRGRWVGFGDVKLGVFLGLALADWKLGLLTFLLANVIGCIVILPGLLTRKLSRKTQVPFGPFLIVGFVVSTLFGSAIVNWYLSMLYF